MELPNPQLPSLSGPETHVAESFVASVVQFVQSTKSLLSWKLLFPLVRSGPGQYSVELTRAVSLAEYSRHVSWQTIFCEVAALVPLYRDRHCSDHCSLTHMLQSTVRWYRSVTELALVQPSWLVNLVVRNWKGSEK